MNKEFNIHCLSDLRFIQSQHRTWCRDTFLKDTYPEFYNIARDRDAKVPDYLEWTNGGIHLNPLLL